MKVPNRRWWKKQEWTGTISAKELFPDEQDRAKIKYIIDIFEGGIVNVYQRIR